MTINSFTKVFACSAMVCMAGVGISCNQNDKSDARVVISKLSRFYNCADSIKSIRNNQLNKDDIDFAVNMVCDSTLDFKALTIVTLFSQPELAQYIFENPSRELIEASCNKIKFVDGPYAVNTFTSSLDSIFNTLSPTQQAAFLTKVASPAECAIYLEDSDIELKIAIENEYADNKSAQTQFEQNLKKNN